MERLKHMKETLMACVEKELCDVSGADTKELGEAIDMIKDLEEAIYYGTITKAMGEKEYEDKYRHMEYYTPMYYRPEPNYDPYRDMDRDKGKMYYSGNTPSTGHGNGTHEYSEREYPMPLDMRDHREGRSPASRKGYMEGKEMHHGKEKQMKELEKYMQELTSDMVEMIQGTSPEEKQLLQKKIATLAEKVGQVSV